MLRLMMLIEDPPGNWRVEVVTLAPSAFPNAMEAELYVFSGEGGVAGVPLWDGTVMRVKRDKVEAICGCEPPRVHRRLVYVSTTSPSWGVW